MIFLFFPQGQRFNSVKEAVDSGQWPNARKKVRSKRGKVEKDGKSKVAPKTKFSRAKNLLKGLLRKNHTAKKSFSTHDNPEVISGGTEGKTESDILSWKVNCDNCDFEAENITALASHKRAKHVAEAGDE